MWKRVIGGAVVGVGVLISLNEKRVGDLRRRGARAPTRFEEGSMEEQFMDALGTGDVILFKRAWHDYHFPDFVSVGMYRALARATFDHAGVIVEDRKGEPFLLEKTFSGVRMRPYEQRVLRSEAKEIVLVPLKPRPDLNNEQREAMFALAEEYAALHADEKETPGLIEGTLHHLKHFKSASSSTPHYTCPSSSVVLAFLRTLRDELGCEKEKEKGRMEARGGIVSDDFFGDAERTHSILASIGSDFRFGEPVVVATKR